MNCTCRMNGRLRFRDEFLLPHFLEEGRGDIDVYFTRVYNPMWINPDGLCGSRRCRTKRK